MNVTISKMRCMGVAQGRETIEKNFKYGILSLGEAPRDETRYRTLRLACFKFGSILQWSEYLYEPQLVWIKGDRLMLSGSERVQSGEYYIEFSQSWMIKLHDKQLDIFIPKSLGGLPDPP
ncbi:hypothetical protein ACO0LF_03845 [Undibacterium sp. Di27W]|uniref:hypothetical protein n=1 Tax=Undibacterium sp. Di27W TaxID=3413036 RepID=UPI003BF26174